MDNEFTIKVANLNNMKELVSILADNNYPVTIKKIKHEWPREYESHYEITITNIEEENEE